MCLSSSLACRDCERNCAAFIYVKTGRQQTNRRLGRYCREQLGGKALASRAIAAPRIVRSKSWPDTMDKIYPT